MDGTEMVDVLHGSFTLLNLMKLGLRLSPQFFYFLLCLLMTSLMFERLGF